MSIDDENRGAPTDYLSESKVSLLIVSWRTPSEVVDAVERALRELAHLTIEIIVVDNDSQDGTVERLLAQFGNCPNVEVVANEHNAGYAGGNNQAFRRSTGDIVVVMNPDVQLNRVAVDAMLEEVRRSSNVGLVSCCLIGDDGQPQTLHRRLPQLRTLFFVNTPIGAWIDHRILDRRMVRNFKLIDRPRLGTTSVGQIGGALIVLRRSLVDGDLKGVLFDESLPILVNDVDLSRRVVNSGRKNLVLWDHYAVHCGGASLRQVNPEVLNQQFWSGLEHYMQVHEGTAIQFGAKVLKLVGQIGVTRDVGTGSWTNETGTDGVASDPAVSIVIPTYNYATYLAEAIESALAQSYKRIEIIVVDDGSTDETAAVLARYSERVRTHRQSNAGLSAARNVGASLASGEYIVFLDADDRLKPRFVELCVEALRTRPVAGFAYTQLEWFGSVESTTRTLPYNIRRLATGNEIAACALIRTTLVRRHPYDQGNRTGWEDWDFWLALAENGWGGILIDEPLVEYRRHDDSMTALIGAGRKRRLKYLILRRHHRLVGRRAVLSALWSAVRYEAGLARRRSIRRIWPISARTESDGQECSPIEDPAVPL